MQKSVIYTGIALIVLLTVFWGLNKKEPPEMPMPDGLKGLIIQSPPTPLPDFQLTTHKGTQLSKKDLKGKWSLIFFGYTHCPDVCPTTLRVMDQTQRDQETPKDTNYIFVSVDPARDTTAVLNDFIEYYNESFIAANGDKQQIDKFQGPLGVIYDFEGDTSSKDYIVTHFAAIYMINPQGELRAYVLPPHSVEQVTQAYQAIRKYYK